MKRKFLEESANYYYLKIAGTESRIRSLNNAIMDREEERDLTKNKIEEMQEMVDEADEVIEELESEVFQLTNRLHQSKTLFYYLSCLVRRLHHNFKESGQEDLPLN